MCETKISCSTNVWGIQSKGRDDNRKRIEWLIRRPRIALSMCRDEFNLCIPGARCTKIDDSKPRRLKGVWRPEILSCAWRRDKRDRFPPCQGQPRARRRNSSHWALNRPCRGLPPANIACKRSAAKDPFVPRCRELGSMAEDSRMRCRTEGHELQVSHPILLTKKNDFVWILYSQLSWSG